VWEWQVEHFTVKSLKSQNLPSPNLLATILYYVYWSIQNRARHIR
jgi:hypothetical protein